MLRKLTGLTAVVLMVLMTGGMAWGQSRTEQIDGLGGFSSGEGLPDGWYGFAAEGGTVNYSIGKNGPDGAASLTIETDAEYGGAAGAHVFRDAKRRYIASIKVKIEGGEPGGTAGVKVDYYDGAGNYISDTPVSVSVGTDGWQTISVMDKAGEAEGVAEVAISLITAGKVKATFAEPKFHSRPNDEGNLLANGGVENVGANGMAEGWMVGADPNGEASIEVVEAPGADGRLAIKFITQGVEWATASPTMEGVAFEKGAKYVLTGKGKAESGTPQLAVVFLNGEDYVTHVTSAPAGSDWGDLRVEIDTSSAADATVMLPAVFASGDAVGFFDTLKLVKQ